MPPKNEGKGTGNATDKGMTSGDGSNGSSTDNDMTMGGCDGDSMGKGKGMTMDEILGSSTDDVMTMDESEGSCTDTGSSMEQGATMVNADIFLFVRRVAWVAASAPMVDSVMDG